MKPQRMNVDRREAGIVSIALCLTLFVGSAAVLLGNEVATRSLDLVSGGAWAVNDGDQQTVSHINIPGTSTDSVMPLGGGWGGVTTTTTINGVLFATKADGDVVAVQQSSTDAGQYPTFSSGGAGTDLTVYGSGTSYYAVRTNSGEVMPVSPPSLGLRPIGGSNWVGLGGKITSAVVVGDELLATVPEPSASASGIVRSVRSRAVTDKASFPKAAQTRLAVGGGMPVLATFTAPSSLKELGGSGRTFGLPTLTEIAGGIQPVFVGSDTRGVVGVVDRGTVYAYNLTTSSTTPLRAPLPAPPKVSGPSKPGDLPSVGVSGRKVYVLTQGPTAVSVDLLTGKPASFPDTTRYTQVAVGSDGAVFNDPSSAAAYAVSNDGKHQGAVTKYESADTQPRPRPVTTPKQGGSGDTAATAPTGSGAGTSGPGSNGGTGKKTPPPPPPQPSIAAPTGVTASPGNAAAQVSWRPAVAKGGASVSRYVLSYVDGAGAVQDYKKVFGKGERGSGVMTTLPDGQPLLNSTQYCFVVRAVGKGADKRAITSAESARTPSSCATPSNDIPNAPVLEAVKPVQTDGDGGALSIAWSPPAPSDAPVPDRYVVQIGGVTPIPVDAASACSSGRCEYIATGLTNGTKYEIQVQSETTAKSGGSTVPWAGDDASRTPYHDPDAPKNVAASSGSTMVRYSWTGGGNGGYDLGHYEYSLQGGGWQSAGKSTSVSEPYAGGTAYSVRVRYVDSEGHEGKSSTSAGGTTPSPTLDVRVGTGGAVTSYCSTNCRWINITGRNFKPNTDYTLWFNTDCLGLTGASATKCNAPDPGYASGTDHYKSITITTDGNGSYTSTNGSNGGRSMGYSGPNIWVDINDGIRVVTSNKAKF